MPPKRLNEKWLLGNPSAILQDEFERYLVQGDEVNMMNCLPFAGPQKLPTNGQVLKLYFAVRNSEKFSSTSRASVAELVSNLTLKYWTMANIPTVIFRTVVARINKLVDVYKKVAKNKTKVNPSQVKEREDFSNNFEKLFDIASPAAEKELVKNRLLGKDEKEEDLKFLEDQRGDRVGSIGNRDQIFDLAVQRRRIREDDHHRREKNENQRKQEIEASEQDLNVEDIDDQEEDDSFVAPKPAKIKKPDKITLEVPRRIFQSPEVTGMLDRLKMSNNNAMRMFFRMIKAR